MFPPFKPSAEKRLRQVIDTVGAEVADVPNATQSSPMNPLLLGTLAQNQASTQTPPPLSTRQVTAGPTRQQSVSAISTPLKVISALIDFNFVDVRQLGKTAPERKKFLIQNFGEFKARLKAAIDQNKANPLLWRICEQKAVTLQRMHQLIDSIEPGIVDELNLSDTRVIDQTPFFVRPVFDQLDDKLKPVFMQDVGYMHDAAHARQQQSKVEQQRLQQSSRNRLEKVHQTEHVHVETLGIGNGIAMTSYWQYGPREQQKNVLFVGQDTGLWQGSTQIAQTSGALEFDAETAASNYNPNLEQAFTESFVDSRHLQQSVIHSQVVNNFPGINAEVMSITGDSKSGYKVVIAYEMGDTIHAKTIHADKLVVGTGLSSARNIFHQKGQFYIDDFNGVAGVRSKQLFRTLGKAGHFNPSGRSLNKPANVKELSAILEGTYSQEQIEEIASILTKVDSGRSLMTAISKEDYENLSQYDAKKGYTPIVDGNKFTLSDSECAPHGHLRNVLVLGGGPTAAAACRITLQLDNSTGVKFDQEAYDKRLNDVTWMSVNGLPTVGQGSPAVDALTVLGAHDKVWPHCELVRIESFQDRMKVTVKKYAVADASAAAGSTVKRMIDGKLLDCVATEQVLEVDQLVYCVGQDSRSVEQLFEDIDITPSNARMQTNGGIPLFGYLEDHPNIEFHGASATTGSMGAATTPVITQSMKAEGTPGDIAPGSMAQSIARIRSTHLFQSGTYQDSVNATVDETGTIDLHLQKWGVANAAAREKFLDDLKQCRHQYSSHGIPVDVLRMLLVWHKLDRLLDVEGSSMLRPKAKSTPEFSSKL